MATTTHVSTPASGAVAIFELITLLTAAGWTVPAWSDGTTLSGPPTPPASNPYGSGASGSGNLGNNSAWFRIAAPDASREWLVQVVNAAATPPTLVINRSKAGFVTGGTATVLPTATDATALFSSAAAFATIPGRLFISADDADGYGWRLMCLPSGGGNVLTLLADVPLDSPDPSDTDPYLWVGYYNATGLTVYEAASVAVQAGYALIYKRFVVAGSNQRVTFASLYGTYGRLAPPQTEQGGALPSSGYDVPLPIPVVRTGAPSTTTGWVGFARGIRWATVQGRASGQTLDGTTEYWIYAAGLWLRWDSSTPTLS